MRLFFVILFSLLFPSFSFCQTSTIDSLLYVLDVSIQHRTEYTQKRQEQINLLQRKLQRAHTPDELLHLYGSLFGKYRAYRLDSASWAAERCVEVARLMPDSLHLYAARMKVAEVSIVTGMYKEGLEVLHGIPKDKLDKPNLFYYYNLYHQFYILMVDYACSDQRKKQYESLAYQYKDSILDVKRPDSQGFLLTKGEKLLYEGEYDKAIPILQGCYDTHRKKGFKTAIPSVVLAHAYRMKGDHEQEKKYLTLSAISDIQDGTKEYISLWKLADLLYEEGDIKRAYTYMECSMEDATFCKARYRTFQISKMLPIINQSYENKLRQEKKELVLLSVLISILSVVLLIALTYIYYQMKRLTSAKQAVKGMNEELKHINADLQILNKKLKESNQLKEEHIGYVFHMCSTYIDKQEELRKLLVRKIKTGQVNDLYKTVNSATFVADELKEFFRMFDSVFLKLYPDFIEEFNALLQENEEIHPREDELLTSELRIFALIRLGISDSGRIANFLHYSSQTVYNYKLKVRNKSWLSKDEFLGAVQKIG